VVSQMVGLEIVPDDLDVIEFGRVFGQLLDGKPMLARFEGGPLSSTSTTCFIARPGWGPYRWSSCSR
jgi:hypothetical protein